MFASIRTEMIKKTSLYILDFLIQSYGAEKYDNIKTKFTIQSILKDDIKKVENTFILPSEKPLIEIAKEFLMEKIFCVVDYFSTEKLDSEMEKEIWDTFYTFCDGFNNSLQLSVDSRPHLIECINYHNRKICDKLLSPTSVLKMKVDEARDKRLYKKLDGYMETLRRDTRLQNDDVQLDFLCIQLESILKSMRYELAMLRNQQRKYLFNIFFITVIYLWVPVFIKKIDYMLNGLLITVFCCVVFLFFINVYLIVKNAIKITNQEKQINQFTKQLYELHYMLYENYFRKNLE